LLKEVGLDEDGIYRSVGTIIRPKRSLLRVFNMRRNGKRDIQDAAADEEAITVESESIPKKDDGE
jgi:hypothetical protein